MFAFGNAATRNLEASLRDVRHERAGVRSAALVDLATHVDDDEVRVLEALTEALRADPVAAVRASAASALADVARSATLPALLEATGDEDGSVRAMALMALGELRDPAAAKAVATCLGDDHAPTRFQAVISYPRVSPDTESSVRALLRATDDDDPLICHIALRMAEELAADRDDDDVDPRIKTRARVLLGHEAPLVRVAAAVLLARCGDRAGARVLVAVAEGELSTPEGEDEAAALEQCGDLGLKAARAALARRAFPGALRLGRDAYGWQARVALAQLGDARARAWIIKELQAWTRERRTLAVAAAGRARLAEALPLLRQMADRPEQAHPDTVADAIARIEARAESAP